MHRLFPALQRYAWGSRSALAELTGRPWPTETPEAELWFGAHPVAPARLVTPGGEVPLDAWIAHDPVAALGATTAARFGGELPFLLKVLAAERPLSLQAHPSAEQAQRGFEREEAAGVPRGATHRTYRDRHHKPELLHALTPFHALSGFRPAAEAARLLRSLGVPALVPLATHLEAEPGALERAFRWLMALPPDTARALVEQAVGAARNSAEEFQREAATAAYLAQLYPGDVGVVAALLLNHVELVPGQALYLPAGNLHAYLGGVGVEIMAASDNVLRGGLTEKHIDVPELCAVLRFEPTMAHPVACQVAGAEHVDVTPAAEFRLSRVTLRGDAATLPRHGPEVVLVTEGEVTLGAEGEGMALGKGEAAFVTGEDGTLVMRGRGTVFRATTGRAAVG